MNGLVSICIPAYKQPQLLARCLRSIVKQTYESIEVYITDDTRDDTVKQIVDDFRGELNISYTKNEKQLGTPANWNEALLKAKGEFVLLLHHDDELTTPESIKKFIEPLQANRSISFVFGRNPSIERRAKNKRFSSRFFERYYRHPELLLTGNYIGAPSNVMLRASSTDVYNEKYKWIVDIDFYIRLFRKKERFFYIDENLVTIGIHNDQVTNDCIDNPDVLLFEYISFAIDNNLLKMPGSVYDFYWRLIRNSGMVSSKRLAEIGIPSEKIPSFINVMIARQKKIPRTVLQNGIASKLFMSLSYLQSP